MENTKTKRIVLLIVSVASFLVPFMSSSINVALPLIGKEFMMDAVLLSWVSTSFLLTAAMFLLPFGKLADIYSRKKIFFYGILIYTIFSFLSAISKSSLFLICFRAFQGIGGAMIFGTSVALLSSVFPPGERGKALGYNSAAVYLGLSLGPFLGGFLTKIFGWQSIFFLNVILGVILIALIFFKLKGEWIGARKEKFDVVGSLFYGFSLLMIIYGFSLFPKNLSQWLILIGVIGFLSFLKWEMKVKNPLLDINLFKNNIIFTFSNLAAFLNYSATFGVSFLLSLYLQYIKGFDPQKAGLVLISQPVVMAVFSPIAGRFSDKIEPRIIASFGMLVTFISLLMFTSLRENTSLEFIVTSLIFLGFGLAFFVVPNTNAIMNSVERGIFGLASAMVATMRLTGQMFSMGISMLMLAKFLGKVQITPQYYSLFLHTTKIIFAIFAFLCFIGIFISFGRKKICGPGGN